MGLAETVKALLLVKADTSQARAELKTLRGVERDAAKERIAELDKHNAGIEDQIKKWAKVTVAIGGVVIAYKAAMGAANAYLEDMRLAAASAGASIDGLTKATAGLVEQDDLMKFAAKAMHGTWQLSQKDMETVLQGAKALRKESGEELLPVIEKLTDAFATGKTRGLKEYGITATTLQGTIRQLREHVRGLGGDTTVAGDDILAAQVSMANSFDDLKGKLGEMVIAMAPALDAFAKLVSLVTDAITGLQGFFERLTGDSVFGTGQPKAFQYQADIGRNNEQIAILRDKKKRLAADLANPDPLNSGGFAKDVSFFPDLAERELNKQIDALLYANKILGEKAAKSLEEFKNTVKTAAAKAPVTRDNSQGEFNIKNNSDLTDREIRYGGAVFSGLPSLNRYTTRDIDFSTPRTSALDTKMVGQDELARVAEYNKILAKWREEQAAFAREAEQAMDALAMKDFATVFGVPEEIDAHSEAIHAMASAFGVLESAAGDAYEALVTGSGSAAEAMKKALANGLLAMGREFFVRSLGETAMGLAAMAIPGLQWNAGQHFIAATAFGSAAIAAGAAAHYMGAGQATSPPSSAGGGRAGNTLGGGRGRSDEQAGPINIYVGSEWEGLSAMERASAINRALRLGRRGSPHIRRG